MRIRNAVLASAVAGLFAAGVSGVAHAEDQASGEKVKCEGVNECKGHSDCKTASNACSGQNACGGQGFKMMTAEECETAKAEAAGKTS